VYLADLQINFCEELLKSKLDQRNDVICRQMPQFYSFRLSTPNSTTYHARELLWKPTVENVLQEMSTSLVCAVPYRNYLGDKIK